MATTKRSTRKGATTDEIQDLRMLIPATTAEPNERNARLAELEAQLQAATARAH